VEMGSDRGHRPARRAYEKAGFGLWFGGAVFQDVVGEWRSDRDLDGRGSSETIAIIRPHRPSITRQACILFRSSEPTILDEYFKFTKKALVMKKYEGFKKAGSFTFSTGREAQGELCLQGAATTLDLYSDSLFDPQHVSEDIFGLLYDRSKVSLINCGTMSSGTMSSGGNEHHHFSSMFPHFVIFGDQHINSSCRVIRELSFTVDDAETLFYDFDVFGLVLNAKPHLEDILKVQERGRNIEIGECPHLFYYTGKYEIFSVDTVIGKISTTYGISYSDPSTKGIHIDNTIRINIAFCSEKSVDDAIASVLDVLKFLEIIAGRPQNISDLTCSLVSTENYRKPFDVYWCMPPYRNGKNELGKPDPFDLPLQAAINSDKFSSVLKWWMERHNEWKEARQRFSTAFAYQNSYNIDRIVGAANMFDILPSSAYPKPVLLSPDLAEARENARRAFKALPTSPERDSILGALGRIGKATLKRKVQSRAKLITDVVGDRFLDLELVVNQAIDCRNYYVHGSDAKIDYSKHFAQVYFFTDTLEFIFAASDLVESGWDIATWITKGSTLAHPFSQYYFNYAQRLSALKDLLSLTQREEFC
jgi:ApeA N-terminal domain 1